MRRLLSGLLLVFVALAPSLPAQSIDSPEALRLKLDEIYRAYVRAHEARDVSELVRLDGELRHLVGPSEYPWLTDGGVRLDTHPEDARIGIVSLVFERDWKSYSGALLSEAHRINPNIRRGETLYSTVATANEMRYAPAAGLRYLQEFPAGPFSSATHYALALFYQDLFQAVTDIMRGRADYHADCYREFIDKRPLGAQRQAALDADLAHWREQVLRFPADTRLQQYYEIASDTERSHWHGWHFCGD